MSARGFAVLAGVGSALLVVLLLSPQGCADTIPPMCVSAFGYSVPDGNWWIAVAVVTGLLVAGVVSSVLRRARTP